MKRTDPASDESDQSLLRAALDGAPQGCSVWDQRHRLVFFNRGYIDLLHIEPGDLRHGMSLRQVCDVAASRATVPGVVAETIHSLTAQRLAAAQNSGETIKVEDRADGRVLRSTYSHSPGLGWVVMHWDATEETENKALAEHRQENLDIQSRRFGAALDNMSHGLSIFDAEMRLVIYNKRYLDIFGLPADQVQPGTPLRRIAELRRDNGTAPADIPDFVGFVTGVTGPPERFVETTRLQNGRSIQATRSPIEGGGFVAVHQDITEDIERLDALTASHNEVDTQKLRFEAALASMPHGLSLYDAEGRLVICNERYRQIYDAPEELCRPGTRFEDVVAHRLKHGTVLPKSHDFVRAVLGETSSRDETVEAFEHANGRIVLVRQVAMADGGTIRIHQDITTQVQRFESLEKAERIAAEKNRVLKRQNMRFDAAVNNMSQGLCMFDKHQRLVVCNEPYAQIYGLPPELTRPGTTLTQVFEHRFAHGMVPKAGREQYVSDRMRFVTDRIEVTGDVEQEDGRIISIHHRPMTGGGWVATHEDVTERRKTEARVQHLARHDALTNLPNRAVLKEEMLRLERRIEQGETVAILCIDLDRFKDVNDTLGHAVGDQVLIETARRLSAAARERDLVIRLGGDEFAVIASGLKDPRAAGFLAERVVKSIARPMAIDGSQVLVGASVGIAFGPNDGSNAEALLKNADMALYRAKGEGRGNYHFFERGMDEALQSRRLLEQGLKVALADEQFRLMYQPLLNLTTNKICSFEALLRWDHPTRGVISPAEFIPVAEDSGLIGVIGEWVLRQACRTAATWPASVRVAVNLSPLQFRNPNLVDQVLRALADANVSSERLELEVTESLLLAETDQTLEMLHQLRAQGVRISLDDFGTGYSSLSYLRAFPFDKIKIDRSFIAGLKPGNESIAIVRAITALGQSLGMSTTAEGVETEAQLDLVREQGCNEVQGFLFSPPLPASSVLPLLGKTDEQIASRQPAEGRLGRKQGAR